MVKFLCLLRQQTVKAFCSKLTRVWRRSLRGTGDESVNGAGYSLACVAGAKRGEGEGEKHERGEREGSVCYKSRCFCYPPTIFSTNPIMSLSIRDQSQVRHFSEWSELNYFVYRKLSSWDAFFKWYQWSSEMKHFYCSFSRSKHDKHRLRAVSHFFTTRSLQQTMISFVWIHKTFYLTTSPWWSQRTEHWPAWDANNESRIALSTG